MRAWICLGLLGCSRPIDGKVVDRFGTPMAEVYVSTSSVGSIPDPLNGKQTGTSGTFHTSANTPYNLAVLVGAHGGGVPIPITLVEYDGLTRPDPVLTLGGGSVGAELPDGPWWLKMAPPPTFMPGDCIGYFFEPTITGVGEPVTRGQPAAKAHVPMLFYVNSYPERNWVFFTQNEEGRLYFVHGTGCESQSLRDFPPFVEYRSYAIVDAVMTADRDLDLVANWQPLPSFTVSTTITGPANATNAIQVVLHGAGDFQVTLPAYENPKDVKIPLLPGYTPFIAATSYTKTSYSSVASVEAKMGPMSFTTPGFVTATVTSSQRPKGSDSGSINIRVDSPFAKPINAIRLMGGGSGPSPRMVISGSSQIRTPMLEQVDRIRTFCGPGVPPCLLPVGTLQVTSLDGFAAIDEYVTANSKATAISSTDLAITF